MNKEANQLAADYKAVKLRGDEEEASRLLGLLLAKQAEISSLEEELKKDPLNILFGDETKDFFANIGKNVLRNNADFLKFKKEKAKDKEQVHFPGFIPRKYIEKLNKEKEPEITPYKISDNDGEDDEQKKKTKIRQLNDNLGKKHNLETTETRGIETEEEEITAKKSGPADPAELQKRMSDKVLRVGIMKLLALENINNQIIGLKKDINNLNETVAKLEVQLTEKNTEIEGIKRDKTQLQNKLDTADNENKILAKEKTDLQTEINGKTEKITELEKDKNDLKTERDANAELAVKHAGVLKSLDNQFDVFDPDETGGFVLNDTKVNKLKDIVAVARALGILGEGNIVDEDKKQKVINGFASFITINGDFPDIFDGNGKLVVEKYNKLKDDVDKRDEYEAKIRSSNEADAEADKVKATNTEMIKALQNAEQVVPTRGFLETEAEYNARLVQKIKDLKNNKNDETEQIKEKFKEALQKAQELLGSATGKKSLVAATSPNFRTCTEANNEFLKIIEEVGTTYLGLTNEDFNDLNFFKNDTISRLDEFLSDYGTVNEEAKLIAVSQIQLELRKAGMRREDLENDYSELEGDEPIGPEVNRIRRKVIKEIHEKKTDLTKVKNDNETYLDSFVQVTVPGDKGLVYRAKKIVEGAKDLQLDAEQNERQRIQRDLTAAISGLATRTNERDDARTERNTLQTALNTRTIERDTALRQKNDLQTQLNTANNTINGAKNHLGVGDLNNLPDMNGNTLQQALNKARRTDTAETEVGTMRTQRDNAITERNTYRAALRDDVVSEIATNLDDVLNKAARTTTAETYLQNDLRINDLNNLPNNNTGQIVNDILELNHRTRSILEATKMLNMVGLIEAFRASQNIGHNDLYNQLVNDHQIIETTWQNYISNSPPANLGQRKLNTLNALAEQIIAANPLTNQNQINNLKTQLNQEKQAHQQTKKPNDTLEKLVQTIKELINKPDLQGALTAAQQKNIELEKELKDKENIPVGEDLENIKDIDLRELEKIFKIKLSAEIVRQMRQVANYQQWAEIRNTEIANYFNVLQNSSQREKIELVRQQKNERILLIGLLVASLLAIGGLAIKIAAKKRKLRK
ncbi:9419_t:CDS:10 [Racocetra fulgida]|uniref:9419_t:CDS:1 n=1 Tax=Racocetra fulgida TaxID=60492 RepID=A0A9N8VEQ1_9GLOM|nr:9419_t:CDS:10 [Racocetra fulgida]